MRAPVSGDRLNATISVGAATAYKGNLQAEQLIERADRALYDAKAHGRNCVRSAADTSPQPDPEPVTITSAPLVTH